MAITIQPAQKDQLDLLNKYLPSRFLSFHADRINTQLKGKGLWLIMWKDGQAIGHCQIVWNGSNDPKITSYIHSIPLVEALYIKPAYRRQGLGTQYMKEMERLVKEQGYNQIGLTVDILNDPALKLYEKLGYKKWDSGDFDASWPYTDSDGVIHWEQKTSTFMFKNIAQDAH